jgi:hypothetical protein
MVLSFGGPWQLPELGPLPVGIWSEAGSGSGWRD